MTHRMELGSGFKPIPRKLFWKVRVEVDSLESDSLALCLIVLGSNARGSQRVALCLSPFPLQLEFL